MHQSPRMGRPLVAGYVASAHILIRDPLGVPKSASIENSINRAVVQRDNFTCVCCGFSSLHTMRIARKISTPVCVADFETMCSYCWLVENLHEAYRLNAGRLIWLPEIDQVEINRSLPKIQVRMTLLGEENDIEIIALKELFEQRAKLASEKFDFVSDYSLQNVIIACSESASKKNMFLNMFKSGLRLLPREKWIDQRGKTRFDAFPRMLSMWRREFIVQGKLYEAKNLFAIQDWLIRIRD